MLQSFVKSVWLLFYERDKCCELTLCMSMHLCKCSHICTHTYIWDHSFNFSWIWTSEDLFLLGSWRQVLLAEDRTSCLCPQLRGKT